MSLAAKCSAIKRLNSGVVIYLLWSWSFWQTLLALGILFSTEVRAVVLAKLVILGISPLASFILALRVALVAKLVISGISSSIFCILTLYTFF